MSRDAVRQHYGTAPLWDRVQAALADAGLDTDAVPWSSFAPLDEFHTRGLAATYELADALGPDLRRPRAETAVFGQQVLWNDECGQGEPPELTGDDRFAHRQLKFHAVGRGALNKGAPEPVPA